MPWKIQKIGSEFCVFDKNGKKLKCYNDKAKAEDYRKALNANAGHKLESIEKIMLENGPVVVGVAVTNIPHLPLPPISVVEKDGEKKIRVPFLRSGIFRHPNGELVFNKQVFNKILENHKQKKSWYGVSLNEKHKPGAALTWFDEERGGSIEYETDPKYGDLLVGYGNPTSQRVLEMVENKEYVFASVELQPNHKSNMIAKLSSDDLSEIKVEDLVDEALILEETMEEVTITLEEYEQLKTEAEAAARVAELEAALEAEKAKVVELQSATAEQEKEKVVELPEEVKLMLETQRSEIARLKQNALKNEVDLVIAKAESYRDANGRGHSPVLLEMVKNAMLGAPVVVSEDVTIKLESSQPADVADYFRKVFVNLLEVVPGQVQLESRTVQDEDKSFDAGKGYSEDEFKSFWADAL